jgi:hypothetical protein
LDTRINDRDIKHLHAFPDERKSAVMRRVMSQRPDRTVKLTGRDDFEKTLLDLRRDGYKLIDLQRHEGAFSSVWYRKGVSMFGGGRTHVTMVVWEAEESGGSTTVLSWRL